MVFNDGVFKDHVIIEIMVVNLFNLAEKVVMEVNV